MKARASTPGRAGPSPPTPLPEGEGGKGGAHPFSPGEKVARRAG